MSKVYETVVLNPTQPNQPSTVVFKVYNYFNGEEDWSEPGVGKQRWSRKPEEKKKKYKFDIRFKTFYQPKTCIASTK